MNFKDYIVIESKVSSVKKILLLVIVAVLMGGCVIGNYERDYASHNTPTTIPIATPKQSSLNWIKFDPISDKQAGEIFTIKSTTNLSAGEEILVQVYTSNFLTNEKSSMRNFNGGVGNATVVPGKNGTNTISFIVNSTAFALIPHEYVITEVPKNEDITGFYEDVGGYAIFNITPRNST